MRKLLLLVLIVLSIFLGYSFGFGNKSRNLDIPFVKPKEEILKVALVADSHNENDLLKKALLLAQGRGVNFVIGLGDYTNLGSREELIAAKEVFEKAGLEYYLIPGDRDGWESREKGLENTAIFKQTLGLFPSRVFEREAVQFVLLDNSDIYKGLSQSDWDILAALGDVTRLPQEPPVPRLRFVFAHKTPFHPQSSHIMGEDSPVVSEQANQLVNLIEKQKVDGFFSGDIHFFARFNSPSQSVKITTIGAVASDRNFQGPRFAILTVYKDYSWEVEDIGIE